MRFEWDATKAASNLRKHGVSFELARRAFYDPWALMEQDRIEHGEYRWQCLGLVDRNLLLLVAYAYRDEEGTEVIRIISARRADRKERKRYEREDRQI